MASRIERESPFTKGGVAALGGAVALCVLGLGQATRGVPTPSSLLFLAWVGAAGLIIVLSRVRLPHALKMGCIIATLGVMFLLAAQSDLFGMKHVTQKIDQASSATDLSLLSGPGAMHSGSPGGAGGAAVHLHPAAGGDLGWSRKLDAQTAGGVGGGAAMWLSFDGSVSARPGDADEIVTVAWSVRGAGAPVRCGMTSIVGRDQQAIVRQVRETFETAATRSNRKGRPSCF